MIKIIKRIWFHLNRSHKKSLLGLFLLMILSSFAEFLSIASIFPFIAIFLNPEGLKNSSFSFIFDQLQLDDKQLFFLITVLFVSSVFLAGVLRVLSLWLQTRFSHNVGTDFSNDIFRKTLYQPYQVHILRNSSEVIAGIARKADYLVYSAMMPLLSILSSGFLFFGIVTALISLNPFAVLISFGVLGSVYGVVIFITKKRLSFYSQVASEMQNSVYKVVQEGLSGIREILLGNLQELYVREHKRADRPVRRVGGNIIIIGQSPRFIIETFALVTLACVTYAISQDGDLELNAYIPLIGALGLGAQRLLPLAQQIYVSYSGFRGGQASICDALELLDQEVSRKLESHDISFESGIHFKDVSFQYQGSSNEALENISIEISKGSRVGIIGETGSGKSTFLDILMGLLAPTKGEIKIDQEILGESNLTGWMQQISHVPQDIYLIDASVMENIAFGIEKKNINKERLYTAAKLACLSETIENMSKGYETQVGERGVMLSGGQKQRLGIARALYRDTSILIFDEATSALDTKTEEIVMESIQTHCPGLTLVMVAHRTTTLKNCDLILEISGGSIIRKGSYDLICQ